MNYKNIFDLTGKRILVTGAGRKNGIGAHVAMALADFGADIALHDLKVTEENKMLVKCIQAKGVCCEFFAQDLSKPLGGKELIEQVMTHFGSLDVAVLNASAQILGDFLSVTSEQVELQLNVNFKANIEILQLLLPKMAEQGWGRIVNMGSVNQRSPKAIVSIYAAAKAAQHNLLMSLAREYSKKGVLLNSIAPGLIDTYPENREGDAIACKQWDDYAEQLNWIGRAGNVEEIVGAAVYLSSNACSFMSGETIYISGGG